MNVSTFKTSQRIWFIILFIFFVKTIFGLYVANFNPNFFYAQDSGSYINPAKEICETGKFNNEKKTPETLRTPGTSIVYLPALCFNLNLMYYTVILNTVLLLLSSYLMIKIIKLIDIKIDPSYIFLIFFIDPTLFRYSYNILSEIIFLFFIVLILYLFILGIKKNSPTSFLAGFLFITGATFIRPIIIYLPYFLIVILFSMYFFNKPIRNQYNYKFLIVIFIGTLAHLILTQLWVDRNYKLANVNEFSTVKNVNLHYYITASIVAKGQKKNWIEIKKNFQENTKNFSRQQFSDYSKKEFKKAIFKYPSETILIGLKGAMMTFFSPGTGQYTRLFNISKNKEFANTIFIGWGLFWLFIVYTFGAYGFLKIKKNQIVIFLILMFFYLLIVSSGPQSYSRFRIPFIPIIVIFACYGLDCFLNNIKNKKNFIKK